MKTEKELLIINLEKVIYFAVRVLAVLMTFVIIWGVIDVGWILYKRLSSPPYFLLNISDILATFGAFLAVLIAIEIFINITIYLKEEIIHVKIVMPLLLWRLRVRLSFLITRKLHQHMSCLCNSRRYSRVKCGLLAGYLKRKRGRSAEYQAR